MSTKHATSEVALRPVERAVAVGSDFEITREQIDLIKQTVGSGLTDLELNLFLNLARAKRLDPLSKQIYAVRMQDKLQMFASIDGLRIIAQRSGQYAGQAGPLWCGPDGEWTDVWLQNVPPAAAKVGVWRAGFKEPTWGVATYQSYGKTKTRSPVWQAMPDVMLAKCAESIALRKAFPDDLSGLYVREEFQEDERSPRDPMFQKAHESLDMAESAFTPMPRRHAPQETFDTGDMPDDDIIDAETGEIVDGAPDQDADLFIMSRDELRADIDVSRRPPLGMRWPDIMQHAREKKLDIEKQDHLVALARDVRQMARELKR